MDYRTPAAMYWLVCLPSVNGAAGAGLSAPRAAVVSSQGSPNLAQLVILTRSGPAASLLSSSWARGLVCSRGNFAWPVALQLRGLGVEEAARQAREAGGDPAQAEEKEDDRDGGDARRGVRVVGCEPGEGDGGDVFAGGEGDIGDGFGAGGDKGSGGGFGVGPRAICEAPL